MTHFKWAKYQHSITFTKLNAKTLVFEQQMAGASQMHFTLVGKVDHNRSPDLVTSRSAPLMLLMS